MSAAQVAVHIRRAGDIREAKELEDFLQRDLGKRVPKIQRYLLREDSRFFPSLIVGVFGGVPDWYEFDFAHSTVAGKPISESEATVLSNSMGLLRLTASEAMFAIDGQHRVEAIKQAWKADLRRKRGPKVLEDDQFSVILVAHIDDPAGKKRSRSLFADINKRAVPVSPGDLAVIDEEEVAIIAARRLYATYPPFKKRISLTKRANLDAYDVDHITNLLTLVHVNKKLKKLYSKKARTKDSDETNVASLYGIARAFYDYLFGAVPAFGSCLRRNNPSISALRLKHRHLLARPVGWVLLAQLYVYFAVPDRLNVLRACLKGLDMDLAGKHFNNVLWAGGKMEPKNRAFAYDLCLYIFRENAVDEKELLSNYRRIVKDEKAALPPRA